MSEFQDKLNRIRCSLDKINSLMSERRHLNIIYKHMNLNDNDIHLAVEAASNELSIPESKLLELYDNQ